jgi:hypothetical protein
MGKFSSGLFGAFTGKVGSMVGSTWKGIEVLRSKPRARKGSFSDEQLQQQAKFSLIVKLLRPLAPLMKQKYGATAVKMTGLNKALSYNITKAVAGAYPAYTVDYARLELGQGDLPNADSATGSSAAAGKLSINWPDNTGADDAAKADDKAFVVVYCEDLNRWLSKQNAAIRSDGAASVDVLAFSGKKVQTYLGFVPAKGKRVTTSLFAGEVSIL